MTVIIPMFFCSQSYGFDFYLKGSMVTDIFPPLEETLGQLPYFERLEKSFDFSTEAIKFLTSSWQRMQWLRIRKKYDPLKKTRVQT